MSTFVPADPFELVIFGATGDLAMRKLLPALFHRDRDEQFSDDSVIIGASRSVLTRDEYVAQVRSAIVEYTNLDEIDDSVWSRFANRIRYCSVDITEASSWSSLIDELGKPSARIRVFYLATMPSLFGDSALQISSAGLVTENARIVVEKPIGSDRESAKAINAKLNSVFNESQIYRIDHYLGKETVQNLSALRFANALFEPLWNRAHIDHVQITVAEKLGVGARGPYYNKSGALRDMVQNHLLQLLCLVAMEPPSSQHHDDIRNEKLKVLKSLKPIGVNEVKKKTARGQYTSGAIENDVVPSFKDDLHLAQESAAQGSALEESALEESALEESDTETYVAIKAEVDNWRWSGTPFYLRTGKRLATKCSEIVVQFKPVAYNIYGANSGELEANRLTIRLQPDEGVQLSIMSKEPGPGTLQLRPVPLNLSFSETFQLRYPDAYERLLMEVFRGNPGLFMRGDEVDTAWAWIDEIIAGWGQSKMPVQPYSAGSWGPKNALFMLDRDGRGWHNTHDLGE